MENTKFNHYLSYFKRSLQCCHTWYRNWASIAGLAILLVKGAGLHSSRPCRLLCHLWLYDDFTIFDFYLVSCADFSRRQKQSFKYWITALFFLLIAGSYTPFV